MWRSGEGGARVGAAVVLGADAMRVGEQHDADEVSFLACGLHHLRPTPLPSHARFPPTHTIPGLVTPSRSHCRRRGVLDTPWRQKPACTPSGNTVLVEEGGRHHVPFVPPATMSHPRRGRLPDGSAALDAAGCEAQCCEPPVKPNGEAAKEAAPGSIGEG
ncbi:hypothetical protein ZWY2020_011968 [Hordeum vulgare]|nr:hypothetical protein ZWY2020_011968 [Hordeum vulgare]